MKDNPIKQEKLRKREELLKRKVNPYPHTWKMSGWGNRDRDSIQELIDKKEPLPEQFFCIAGRLMRKRPMGKADFFNLEDEHNNLQCYIRRDDFVSSNSDLKSPTDQKIKLSPWELWKLCDIGDILSLRGKLFKTKRGELSLRVQSLKILCKSVSALPEKYHGLEDKELKYRYRYMDLIMDQKSKKIFKIRSQVITEIRNFMNKKGFMEVETPVLQSVYGGALAEPFETHFRRLNNKKMYLKISPEIYLKKLIVGGFEKVYEIGKNFRNEGIDRTHNPEFTMMEYYEAYTDYKYQMKQFEKLVNYVVKKIKGSLKIEYQGKELNFGKWETLSLKEAIKKYSDLENNNQENLREALSGSKNIDISKISFPDLFKFIKKLEPKGDYRKYEEALNIKYLSSEKKENLKGALAVLVFEILAEKHLWNPTFIIDFPLSVSPLTKKHRKKQSKYKTLVERFEPYIAGMELGNAYTELNDPIDQRERLEEQNRWEKKEDIFKPSSEDKNFEDSHPLDENFIHALELGMPPTGGVGLGIERLVMILTDQKSIRDCILLPP
ncbi:MAG: lysine--tRNA ligase [Bdellovibrionaceae bacterium]|nr:lysine--tRNA ligase [Pseudobdellovibrionaceae bacterium]